MLLLLDVLSIIVNDKLWLHWRWWCFPLFYDPPMGQHQLVGGLILNRRGKSAVKHLYFDDEPF